MASNQLWLHFYTHTLRDIFSCHNLGRVLHPTMAGQQNYLAMCQLVKRWVGFQSLIVVSLCCSLQAQGSVFLTGVIVLVFLLSPVNPLRARPRQGSASFQSQHGVFCVVCWYHSWSVLYFFFLFPVCISFWSLPLLRRSALRSFPFFPKVHIPFIVSQRRWLLLSLNSYSQHFFCEPS